jgi:hypothetical protein
MAHVSSDTLDRLEPLLEKLRMLGVIEKSRGIFYTKRGAFVHFHEDEAGVHADVKCQDGWQRLAANTKSDFSKVVALAKAQQSKS